MTEPKYPHRPRTSSTIPFGYRIAKVDKNICEPIEEQLDALEEAKQYVRNGCSLRDSARWLTATTDRLISHVGLRKIMITETNRKKRNSAKGVYFSTIKQVRQEAWNEYVENLQKERDEVNAMYKSELDDAIKEIRGD